jgi:hypothetical protein
MVNGYLNFMLIACDAGLVKAKAVPNAGPHQFFSYLRPVFMGLDHDLWKKHPDKNCLDIDGN